MDYQIIEDRVAKILESIPKHVSLVIAAKTRTTMEIEAAIKGGAKIFGYNYLKEAEKMYSIITQSIEWHMIGHLQRNKAKTAVKIFDMIETIDSVRIAKQVEKSCELENKVIPVLIEINSGKESNKTGVLPEEVEKLLDEIKDFSHLRVKGLMTMGPRFGNPELARPYFRSTKLTFDKLKRIELPNIEMEYLSMGMSNTYNIAIEEGANIVRIGSKIFTK